MKEIKTASEIVDLIAYLHFYPQDLEEDDLLDRIYQYPFYVLQEIPLSSIDSNEWEVAEERVQENIKEYHQNPDYPPIVYDLVNKSIIDGIHRVNALIRLGIQTVKAYVGSP